MSDVALMWMVNQARSQGISIREKTISDNGWDTITNPIVHDKSQNHTGVGEIISGTRDVVYGSKTHALETSVTFDGKSVADAIANIKYCTDPYRCGSSANPDVGLVDMVKYNQWLATYGMTMPTGPTLNPSCW